MSPRPDACVGIAVNPASGKDVRRLTARASVFDNQEKRNIVRRFLAGVVASGVKRVRYVADTHNIAASAVADVPEHVNLASNYPNPFNPETVLPVALPEEAHVSLIVYDVLGRRVAVLQDGRLPAGRHKIRWRADHLPSGVYFARMVAAGTIFTRRLTLVK